MPLYLYQAAYTAESLAAQIKEPKDRIEVVKPVFEAAGGKILASGYPFGEYAQTVPPYNDSLDGHNGSAARPGATRLQAECA